MMDQTRWAGLSVQAFFQGYNWLGETPKLEQTVTESQAQVTVPSLLCLKVQDFLHQANWRGLAIEAIAAPRDSQALEAEQAFFSSSSSLQLSVFDFFQRSNWQGQGNLFKTSPEPAKKAIPLSHTANAEIDLTDLSALF
ncbi:MAG: hypothetical protein VKL42_19860 [Snowella sp.]|nr:hypothetical protein [Snowella sp.]